MDGNSAYQHTDANISFGRNGTNIATAPEIGTEQNAAYTHALRHGCIMIVFVTSLHV